MTEQEFYDKLAQAVVEGEDEIALETAKAALEAGVIGVPDEKWGERPLAVVIPVEGASESLDENTLNVFLQSFVDDGSITKWAVPDHYVFVEKLPRTSVGKIDKKALRLQYATPPSM